MARVTKSKRNSGERDTIVMKTKVGSVTGSSEAFRWWNASSKADLSDQILSTASFLKEQQKNRFRQAAIHAHLYGNMPIANVFGSSMTRLNQGSQLPIDRPTMNVIQSCIDTLVSKITQMKPSPMFLTDDSDYRERTLAKNLNHFILGEFYQNKAHQKGEFLLRDACVLGTGHIKVFEKDKRVAFERTVDTEIFTDPNDAIYGEPRQMFQLKLIDRSVAAQFFPDKIARIERAGNAFPDRQADSQKTASDQIMIVEAWHLPSAKGATDGLHAISCTEGLVFEEPFTKLRFPFASMSFSPRLFGVHGQGLAEQLMGTQVDINKLLMTISKSINLVGVPRVFVEDGSKVVKAHLNDEIGSIVTYRGTKPSYEVAPCMPQEVYAQLQRLIEYAYQQSGVSALSATAQKPAGLNSGEAIRNYNDLQSDRFAALQRRYENVFIDLAYLTTDLAKDIAEREGKYETVYPGKNGVRKIDLPYSKLIENPYVIQCFDTSMLPHEPAGRLEKVSEMAQSGMITLQEARRLLSFPDLTQQEKLANAAEERILQVLDEIVESASYSPPDPFTDLELATKLTTQYINLYGSAKLEEKKMQLLRDYFTQLGALKMAATPPAPAAPGPMEGAAPLAVPMAPPVSPLLPNAPNGGA